MISEYKSAIIREIDRARENTDYMHSTLKSYTPNTDNKNEAVFFIKPEITGPDSNADISSIIDLIDASFQRFSVSVDAVKVLGAAYLKKYGIMEKHYGVINRLAREGKTAFSPGAVSKFEEVFGVNPSDATVLGAFQFLERYPFFNPSSQDVLWSNTKITKLASGTYCAQIKVFDDTVYLVNGFHPHQLEHFTGNGKSIVVMVISSNTDWRTLRDVMVGSTDPKDAVEGSIRRTLLDRKDELGLRQVDRGFNGVHLSAGPLEAVAETVRFVSDYEGNMISPGETAIGKRMIAEGIPEEQIEWLINNPKVTYRGEEWYAFDLTECMNTDDMITVVKEIIGRTKK